MILISAAGPGVALSAPAGLSGPDLGLPSCLALFRAAMVDPHRLQGLTLAFCAGTGRMGSNLARLYALAGFRVIIGSRDPAKAQALAQQLRDQHPDSQLRVEGASNAEAAAAADVVHWCIMVRCKRSMPYAPMERE